MNRFNRASLAAAVLGAALMVTASFPGLSHASPLADGNRYRHGVTYQGDCAQRPAGTVCVRFDDGFVWLINESVVGWESHIGTQGTVQIANGSQSSYHHILYTNLIMKSAR